jgi:hypothetical protein
MLLMFLPHEEAKEIMLPWEPGSVITNAVIWYNEYLDKVARRITVAIVQSSPCIGRKETIV